MTRWIVTAGVAAGLFLGAWNEGLHLRAWSLRTAAETSFYAGEVAEALVAYRKIARLLPSYPYSYVDPADSISLAVEGASSSRATARELESMIEDGVRLYLEAIRTSPPNAWSYAGIGSLAGRLHSARIREAGIDLGALAADPIANLTPADRLSEAALAQAVRIEPNNYYYRDFLGDFYMRRGFDERALAHIRTAARLQPVLGRHYYLGDLINVSPDVLVAVESGIQEALTEVNRDARSEQIYRFLGQVYLGLGRWQDARSSFESAAEVAQDPYLLDIQIGRTLEREGDLEGALAAFTRSAERRPDYYRSWLHLGATLSRLERYPEAVEALRRARGIEPTEYQPAWLLARALHRSGETDEALRILETLVWSHPERREPYQQLIEIHQTGGNTNKAVRMARRLASLYPDESVYQEQVEQLEKELAGRR